MTPAHRMYDGHNYYPTSRWVLFGHHFAAITGAGPLIGPVLAAQFGYAPGLIWLVAGVCLAGAVHDYVSLWASTRRGGRSLAEITRTEIGPVAGTTAAIAILFIGDPHAADSHPQRARADVPIDSRGRLWHPLSSR